MKNAFQKIATIIIIAIGVVFAVVLALMCATIINNVNDLGGIFTNERIGFLLLLILGVVFVGLAVYMVFSMFGGKVNIKTMVLTSDNFSVVSTTNKVVRGIVQTCVKSLGGVKLQQTKITEDDKPGFKLAIKIKINDGNAHEQAQRLKFVLEDSFKKELGFGFNTIIIKVTSLKNAFTPDVDAADAFVMAKAKEEVCKNSCKIAEPTPADQTVLEKNLTPEELNSVARVDDEQSSDEMADANGANDISAQKEEDNTIDNSDDAQNEASEEKALDAQNVDKNEDAKVTVKTGGKEVSVDVAEDKLDNQSKNDSIDDLPAESQTKKADRFAVDNIEDDPVKKDVSVTIEDL